MEERTSEANTRGYDLLSKISKDVGEYLHRECGSISKFQFGHMRSGNIKCRHCMRLRFEKESAKQGYSFIEQVNAGDEARYKHEICGNEGIFQIAHMRIGNIVCKFCKIIRWKSEANLTGFEWLRQVSKDSSEYKHTKCDRVSKFQMGSVPQKCPHCQEDKYKGNAFKHGYTWLKRHKGVKSLYSHNDCGHVQAKSLDNMRRGSVKCDFCESSWYTRNSTLYLIKIESNGDCWLKLGISRDTNKRTARYGLPKNCNTTLLDSVEYKTGQEAIAVENSLHKKYSEYGLKSEDMRKLMGNGFTECYKCCATNDLLREFQILKGNADVK